VTRRPAAPALTGGFRLAYLVAAGLVVAAIAVVLSLGIRAASRRAGPR
jgi:hypothetical protein